MAPAARKKMTRAGRCNKIIISSPKMDPTQKARTTNTM